MLFTLLSIFTLSVLGDETCRGTWSRCTLRCELGKDRTCIVNAAVSAANAIPAKDCKDEANYGWCSKPACLCTPLDGADHTTASPMQTHAMDETWMNNGNNAYIAKFCSKLSTTMCSISKVCGILDQPTKSDGTADDQCYYDADLEYGTTLMNYFHHQDRCRCVLSDPGIAASIDPMYCSALGWDGCAISQYCQEEGYSPSTTQPAATHSPCLTRDEQNHITQFVLTFTSQLNKKFSIHLLEGPIAEFFADLIVIDQAYVDLSGTLYPAYGPKNIYVHPDVEWNGNEAKIFISILTKNGDGNSIVARINSIGNLQTELKDFFNSLDQTKGVLTATLSTGTGPEITATKSTDVTYPGNPDANAQQQWMNSVMDETTNLNTLKTSFPDTANVCKTKDTAALIECEDCKCQTAKMRHSSESGGTLATCKALAANEGVAYFNFVDLPIYSFNPTRLKVKGSRCVFKDYTQNKETPKKSGTWVTINGSPNTATECVTNRLSPANQDPTADDEGGPNPKPWSIFKTYTVCKECEVGSGHFDVCENCKCDGAHHYQSKYTKLEHATKDDCAAAALAAGYYFFSYKEGPGWCVFGMEESSTLACVDNRIYTKSPDWSIGYNYCTAS